jgi:hypothetical protein
MALSVFASTNRLGARRPPVLLRSLALLLLVTVASCLTPCMAADAPAENDGARVLQSFERQAPAAPAPDAGDTTRRWVMFGLAAPLLILLLTTAGLGIAMGVYGKPVYLAHMVCAGLSITLAIAHAVAGIVWFRPF